MTLTFDRNLTNQRSMEVMFFGEQILETRLIAGREIKVSQGQVFPDISAFVTNRTFSTVEAVDSDEVAIPIVGTYNTIINLSINYSDVTKSYNLTLTLGYVVPS